MDVWNNIINQRGVLYMHRKINHIIAGVLAGVVIYAGGLMPAYAHERDSVYLANLSLSKSNIDFSEDVFYYTARVSDDADEIKVRAKPKNEKASVSIDGDYVDEDDNYKRVIDLNRGSNIVKVVVNNSDDESKTYTINIIKGEGEKDDIYLDKLKVNNNNIDLNRDDTEYNMDVNKDVNKVSITAIPEDDNSEVTIDGGNVTSDNNYTASVDLSEGTNPIVIKVAKKKDKREYLLNINRKSALDGKTDQDNIYLDYIKLDKEKINLDNIQTEYNAVVNEDVGNIYITAEPESVDYKVKINDKVVEEEDDYKDFVKLNKGKNRIKITVQDLENNKQRIYYLNIFRGEYIESINQNTTIDNQNKTECNKWIKSEKGWQYNDAIGQAIKSTWFYDINYGSWYYLDDNGIMKTGWFKDTDGKWYYFNEHGSMLKDTYIGMYKLGSDGTMI